MYREYDDETLKKLHTVELEILKDFVQICEKYDINYFICFGCAIGAMRHKGFIPWDDDIDVCMLRKDYEKFLEAAPKEIKGKYELMGPDCPKKYYNLVPNMGKAGTTFATVFDRGRYNCGIFIDIYPFDYVFADIKKREKQIAKTNFYRNLYLLKNINFYKLHEKGYKKKIKHSICAAAYYFLNIFHVSNNYIYKQYLKNARICTEKTKMVTTFSDTGAKGSTMSIDEIFPLQDADFEYMKIKLPHKCHEILTRKYGDYMVLPPISERHNHPPSILSFNNKEFIYQDNKI